MKPTSAILAACLLLLTAGCRPARMVQAGEIRGLKLLGTYYSLPQGMSFRQTTVGGISGIDYDSGRDRYYLLSDDRSVLSPARFYTARIGVTDTGITSVQLLSMQVLKDGRDSAFPSHRSSPTGAPDPESIRFHAPTGQLFWSSEGERIVHQERTVLQDPFVARMDTSGRWLERLPLPSRYRMRAEAVGPRQNGVFEGLSFGKRYRELWVALEEPLHEDGPRAGLGDSTAWVRILRHRLPGGTLQAEYAYRLDAVVHPVTPPGGFRVNGVSEILVLNDRQLLVMERSYSTGRKANSIRLYLATHSGATDVQGIPSLHSASFVPLRKTLLLDLDRLRIYTDNLEGITFGPRLPDGRRTLLLVADDNFSEEELTQFFLFALE